MKDVLSVLKIVSDFLNTLTDENIKDLIEGKANLRIEYPKAKKKKEPKRNSLIDICYTLELMESRSGALDYLKSANLTNKDLKIIAKEYNIPIMSKDKKSVIIEKIVEGIVGSKLRFDTLLKK